MKLILETARIAIWLVDGEYYIYGVTQGGDPRIAHSEGAAREIAAAAL